MQVIFVEPAFPHNQRQFVRALAAVGARVIGIGERPLAALDDELRNWLTEYVQIGSVVHEPSLLDAVRHVQRQVWADRKGATRQAHIMPAGQLREACGIPGTAERTAWVRRGK